MSAAIETGIFCRSFRGARLSLWKKPARNAAAGGDWCDAFPLNPRTLAISIGDVCGHGTLAYEQMLELRESMCAGARQGLPLFEIVAKANALACTRPNAAPVTALVALFDATSRRLSLVSAGHPRPLLHTTSGSAFLGAVPGALPLGITQDHTCTIETTIVPSGALLIFYTDGILEHTRDAIKGERDLMLAAAHVYRYPYLNAAHTMAHEITGGTCLLEDDAALLTVRIV